MGYTVKKDGTRAWSTTELNCPQTAEGECICEDGKEEVTIFDKADQIVEAAANIDAAGGDSTLLDLVYGMPEIVNGSFPLEPVTDTPDDIYYENGSSYTIYFQNLEPGDTLKFFMPFNCLSALDERLIPYIKRVIICRSAFNGYLTSTMDYHTQPNRAFLITEGLDESVRLHGEYFLERLPHKKLIGRKLSKGDDFNTCALTGSIVDNASKFQDAFLNAIPYTFLKRAYIADGGIYLEYKVNNEKIDTSDRTSGHYVSVQIHFPKNEIIKAIEEEMKGKK